MKASTQKKTKHASGISRNITQGTGVSYLIAPSQPAYRKEFNRKSKRVRVNPEFDQVLERAFSLYEKIQREAKEMGFPL